MSEHTPGPWTVVDNEGAYVRKDGLVDVRVDQEGDFSDSLAVALIISDCPRLSATGESLANARLIAKAPEMFALLESFANDFAHDGDRDERCRDSCRACRAAGLLQEIGKSGTS